MSATDIGKALAAEFRPVLAEMLEKERAHTLALIRKALAEMPPGEDRLVELREAARLVGLRPESLQKRAARGSLPEGSVVRHGRRLMFRVRALLGHGEP